MRWPVFIVLSLIAIVLETSVAHAFRLHTLGGLRPSFAICLLTYVAMFAPRGTALWAAWGLGLLVDLCTDLPQTPSRVVYLPGPHALGYVFACYLIIQIRAMLLRRRVLTFVAMTTLASAVSSLVIVAIYSVRRWYPEDPLNWTEFTALGELASRLGDAAYSGVIAIVIGWFLLTTTAWWGFQVASSRR